MGLTALLALLAAGGCSPLWHTRPGGQSAESAQQGDGRNGLAALLKDAARFGTLSTGERQLELFTVENRYQQQRSPYNLLRVALLMALSDPDRPDGAAIRSNLKYYVARQDSTGAKNDLGALASVLLQVLEARAALLRDKDVLQRKVERYKADVDRLNKNLDQHEADEQKLNKQLNQLKAIEQKLNERGKREMIQVPP